MRFGEKELHILGAAELNAHLTNKELAKLSRLREHTVRYYLEKLENYKIISKRPLIDMHKLGLVHYTMLVSLKPSNQRTETELIQALRKTPHVTWIFKVAGQYQYGLSISTFQFEQTKEHLAEFRKRYGELIYEVNFSIQHSMTYFGRRYLLRRQNPSFNGIFFSISNQPVKLTKDESTYLNLISEGRYPTLQLQSKMLNVPISTINDRKNSLIEKGVIRGSYYWIDANLLNRRLYLALIYESGFGTSLRELLLAFAKENNSIIYFIEGTGNWSFEFGIEVEDPNEISKLTQDLYAKCREHIKTINMVPLIEYVKWKAYNIPAA